MSKQTLAIAVAAIVLFAAAVIGAMALTSGGDSGVPMMTMADGSIMPVGQMTPEGAQPMDDGSTTEAEETEP